MRHRDVLSNVLSLLFMPQISSAYVFAALALASKDPIPYLAVAVLFSSLIQVASLLAYAIKSKSDMNVADTKGRSVLFAIAIASYFAGFCVFWYISAPFILGALMLSYTLNTLAAAAVTRYLTRVSIHVWGISGPAVAVLYSYGFIGFLAMLLLAAVVGAARIELRRHTTGQVLLSFVLSVPITLFVIYVLSPAILR
jgi:hypothetical protein